MAVNKQVQAVLWDESSGWLKVLLVKKLDAKSFVPRWRLLKGSIEVGESEETALAREIKEEVGLTTVEIGEKIYEYNFSFGDIVNQVKTFSVKGDSSRALKIQTKEIADARWFSLDEAKKVIYWPHEKKALEAFEVHYRK
jgi:NAD+ diphosphatase